MDISVFIINIIKTYEHYYLNNYNHNYNDNNNKDVNTINYYLLINKPTI